MKLVRQRSKKEEVKNFERKKRKGVGYTSNVGQTWNVNQYIENKKQRNEQIKNLIDILASFVMCKEWKAQYDILEILYGSALLPILENAMRAGSLLDMAKESDLFFSYFGTLAPSL